VTITTPDGTCDAYFVAPTSGPAPGVLVWPDIFGLRPAFRQMGRRLAESGYSVLVVNPFYRQKKAPTAAQGGKTPIAEVMPLMQALTPAMHLSDGKAFVPGSIRSLKWTRRGRWAPPATAWAGRSPCAPPPWRPAAWALSAPSTAPPW
jgi:dienelactone hydrolase